VIFKLTGPFSSVLQLYSTDNINQRDKHEANLKTEIKKLQRFREQIKTWHANNDIKDKTPLADARSNIERRMEKFKVCEKEAKTKAFSKEGLQAAASRMDPKEKAKQEMRDWLNTTVDHLNTQIEEFEAEVEDLSSSGGKKKGKVPPRVTHLEESTVRHKQHIARLEQMLRLLDNDEITSEDVENIKDLVDDYIDRNQESPEEFDVPDDLYADVLEALENMSEAVVAAPPSHSKSSAKDREIAKEKEREEKERERQKAAALAAKAQLAAQGNTRLMTETEDEKRLPGTPAAAAKPVAPPAPPALFAPGGPGQPTAASIVAAAPPPPPPPPPRAPGSKDSPAAVGPAGSAPSTPLRGQGVGTPSASPLTPSSGTTPAGALGQGESFPSLGVSGNGVKQLPVGHAAAPATAAAMAPAEDATNFDAGAMDSGLEQLATQLDVMGIQDSTAGLSPAQCLQLLQAAAPRSIPQPSDSTWQQLPLRPRPPPVAAPPSYPTSRLPVFDNPALFEKLDPESLFFAFYQQPGTYQQCLAARSLKQQAWRFHKQHQAWFQRHDEPKSGGQPGDDWEQGSYVYFDNLLRESADGAGGGAPAGWVYRLKNEFLFKYDALENELNV
jgi:CCR4-NOT transcription complex subunit 3